MAGDRRSPPGLLQMVQQNDEKHEAAHTRLRLALDRLEARVEAGESSCVKIEARVSTLERTRPEFEDMRFTPQRVAMIVGAVLTVAGGMYASTYGLRSDVRDILTRTDAAIKLQDERSNTLRSSIDEMKRRVELQQFQIGELKDMLLKQQAGAKR